MIAGQRTTAGKSESTRYLRIRNPASCIIYMRNCACLYAVDFAPLVNVARSYSQIKWSDVRFVQKKLDKNRPRQHDSPRLQTTSGDSFTVVKTCGQLYACSRVLHGQWGNFNATFSLRHMHVTDRV